MRFFFFFFFNIIFVTTLKAVIPKFEMCQKHSYDCWKGNGVNILPNET